MRYYFDIKNHPDVIDTRGENCRTQADARARARKVAKERVCQGAVNLDGSSVVVKDESGLEIFSVRLKDDLDEEP